MPVRLQENPSFRTGLSTTPRPDRASDMAPTEPAPETDGRGWVGPSHRIKRNAKHQAPRDFAALTQAAKAGRPDIEITCSGVGPWFQFRVPTGFLWKTARLPIAGLPDALQGLRILQLSDLHLRTYWGRPYDELIERIRAANVDLILITGDVIDHKTDHRPALPMVRRLIPHLHSRLGTYAIQGNHDPDLLMPKLAEMGVHVITHRRALLSDGQTELELIGLNGATRAELDESFLRRLPPKRPETPRVVMCHYPDLISAAQLLDPDIYLAGHTHGGQICLPGGRPLMTHDAMPKPFTSGIHRIGRAWYCVSKGLGFSGPPVRLFCPAEVVELVLVKEM